ncbi:WD40 repeat-like protein [Panus rudis PR-1116 ss-1]|nr:WD40 repeat-like protein [Panus rudis PR-1116 ss-1]
MRVRTLEIRWHDSKPISTCDFQPVAYKKARPAREKDFATQTYKLATGGEDNHVRLWLVHPNILPQSVAQSASIGVADTPVPRPPRVEYLATLSRHSAAVNVVRWSPNGELIASAGDDGMIIIWAPSTSPHTAYGSDLTPEELQYEKEHWKPRTTFRCTTMQVYDLAWSSTGEYIIAGSTDNCARIFTSSEGKCVHEIAEHNHFVQGVAWDPLNEYVATQSSDRSMHIYSISTKNGALEVHAVGKNTRIPHRSSRAPSVHNRPRIARRESTTSEAESVVTALNEFREENAASFSNNSQSALLTPTASVASTPSTTMFPPPPFERTSSRRSSFSSTTAGSPAVHARYARSPSPMPALPAIRANPNPSWSSVKLYGDESYTNFFRRLAFSPDGGLLLTPAGQFEDPSIQPPKLSEDQQPSRGRKGGPTPPSSSEDNATTNSSSTTTSCVYIYTRANFARPPVARLPGHKKPSVAVKFSPILYELRSGVTGGYESGSSAPEPKSVTIERGSDKVVDIDMTGPSPRVSQPPSQQQTPSLSSDMPPSATPLSPLKLSTSNSSSSNTFFNTANSNSNSNIPNASSSIPIVSPSPRSGMGMSMSMVVPPSPALSATDSLRPPTPMTASASKPATPAPNPNNSAPPATAAPTPTPSASGGVAASGSASIFSLPYRMLYAVATMDTVTIYDTQQAGPVCLLTNLHYDEFTDMSWSPDGQTLILSSRDGYCTLVVFDEILPAYHTQQQTLQFQSIAHHHSLPLTNSAVATPMSTPSVTTSGLPNVGPLSQGTPVHTKRSATGEPPLTPAASVDENMFSLSTTEVVGASGSGNRHGKRKNVNEDGDGGVDAADGGGRLPGNSDSNDKTKSEAETKEPPKKKRRAVLTKVGDLD